MRNNARINKWWCGRKFVGKIRYRYNYTFHTFRTEIVFISNLFARFDLSKHIEKYRKFVICQNESLKEKKDDLRWFFFAIRCFIWKYKAIKSNRIRVIFIFFFFKDNISKASRRKRKKAFTITLNILHLSKSSHK